MAPKTQNNVKRDFHYCQTFAAFVGASGYGKSTLQTHFVKGFRPDHLIVFDYKGQLAPALGAKFVCSNERELNAAMWQSGNVVFSPGTQFPGRLNEGFAWFLRWAYAAGQRTPGEKLLVFDEVGLLLPAEKRDYDEHPMRLFTETGREWRWNMAFCSQYPVDLCTKFRNQVNAWFVFNLGEKSSLKGLPGGYKAHWPTLEKLRVGEFLAYDRDRGRFERGKLTL